MASQPIPNVDAIAFVRKQAMINSAFNGLINGAFAWWEMEPATPIPLTLDSISSGGAAVLGPEIASAFTMGLMVTMMSFLRFRKKPEALGVHGAGLEKLRFWPSYPALAVKNALFVFGALVVAAILWQKMVGTVEVGRLTAVAVVVLVAAAATGYATTSTMRTMLSDAALAELREGR